jgi:hypothetical protein
MWNINAGTELRGWYLYVRCSATALSDGSVELLIPDTKEPPSWHTLRKWGIRVGTAFTTYVFFLPAQDAALLSRLRATVTLTNGKISVIELRAPYHPLSAYNQAALSDASLVAGTSATLDAGANIFDAGHVGALFGILGKTKAASYVVLSPAKGTWTSSVFPDRGSWNITLECISPGNRDQAALYLERSLDEGSSWQRVYAWPPTAATTQMALSGTEVAPCLMRFVRDEDPTSGDEVKFTLSVAGEEAWAFFRVTAVGLANSATVTLLTDYDHPGTTFLTWAEGAWSDVRGWPACVSFFEDRLVFANTKTQPQTLWMSRTSSYLDFSASIPVQDDDAVTATLVSRKVNAIRAILSMGDLLVLTSGAEYRVGTDGNGPITPTNISARPQGYRGAAAVDPEPVGNTLLYVQSKGAAIRELAFDNNAQGYDGNDVSVLSKHLLEGHSLLELAYQQEPWSVLWGVRDDGVLLGLTYMREHQVFAWHWHETQGAIEAVCTIPGAGEDEVWFVARRTVGGSTKRYIERLASRRSEDLLEAHFVDSGLDYSGDPAAVLSGLDHLEGCTVTALADGVVRAGLTVTGGQVTLPFAASRVHVGLPYTSDLETLGIEYQANGGTAQGKLKRIGAVTLRISNSRGGKAGPDAAHLEALSYPSEVTGPYSGDRKVHLKSTYDTAGRVFIRQSDPLPFTVLAVIPEVTSGE